MKAIIANRKGMALYLVLAVLIVVVMVAGMFLNLVLSQSRLTHHQVSRSQSYFAARLGMNYAIEMLRTGDPAWPATGTYRRIICKTGPCDSVLPYKVEPDLPDGVRRIIIDVGDVLADSTRPLNVTVDYAYQP
jgi:Tfp pilus assembly protein PilX